LTLNNFEILNVLKDSIGRKRSRIMKYELEIEEDESSKINDNKNYILQELNETYILINFQKKLESIIYSKDIKPIDKISNENYLNYIKKKGICKNSKSISKIVNDFDKRFKNKNNDFCNNGNTKNKNICLSNNPNSYKNTNAIAGDYINLNSENSSVDNYNNRTSNNKNTNHKNSVSSYNSNQSSYLEYDDDYFEILDFNESIITLSKKKNKIDYKIPINNISSISTNKKMKSNEGSKSFSNFYLSLNNLIGEKNETDENKIIVPLPNRYYRFSNNNFNQSFGNLGLNEILKSSQKLTFSKNNTNFTSKNLPRKLNENHYTDYNPNFLHKKQNDDSLSKNLCLSSKTSAINNNHDKSNIYNIEHNAFDCPNQLSDNSSSKSILYFENKNILIAKTMENNIEDNFIEKLKSIFEGKIIEIEIEYTNSKNNKSNLILYQKDIERLNEPNYLNDNLIFFYLK